MLKSLSEKSLPGAFISFTQAEVSDEQSLQEIDLAGVKEDLDTTIDALAGFKNRFDMLVSDQMPLTPEKQIQRVIHQLKEIGKYLGTTLHRPVKGPIASGSFEDKKTMYQVLQEKLGTAVSCGKSNLGDFEKWCCDELDKAAPQSDHFRPAVEELVTALKGVHEDLFSQGSELQQSLNKFWAEQNSILYYPNEMRTGLDSPSVPPPQSSQTPIEAY